VVFFVHSQSAQKLGVEGEEPEELDCFCHFHLDVEVWILAERQEVEGVEEKEKEEGEC
jgi:hypothetical protein